MHFVWNMHTHYRYTYISSCDKKRCITDLSKCKENCLLPINGEMCYTTLWPLCMVTWKQGAVYKKAKALWFFCELFLPSKFFFYYLMFSLGGGWVRFGTAEICMDTHPQGICSKLVWGKCSFMLLQFLGAPDPSCFSWHTSGAKLKVEKDMMELIRSHCWVFLRGGFRKLAWQREETYGW